MALKRRAKAAKSLMPRAADSQVDAVCRVLRLSTPARTPQAQAALVVALLRAMGGPCGVMPSLVDIATELGVCHQRVYRTLAALEERGVVRRSRIMEISL